MAVRCGSLGPWTGFFPHAWLLGLLPPFSGKGSNREHHLSACAETRVELGREQFSFDETLLCSRVRGPQIHLLSPHIKHPRYTPLQSRKRGLKEVR